MDPPGHTLDERELAAGRACSRPRAARHRLDAELERDHGLPLTSYEVLLNLADADGEAADGELADRLLLSRSGMTRLVDRLEEQRPGRAQALR